MQYSVSMLNIYGVEELVFISLPFKTSVVPSSNWSTENIFPSFSSSIWFNVVGGPLFIYYPPLIEYICYIFMKDEWFNLYLSYPENCLVLFLFYSILYWNKKLLLVLICSDSSLFLYSEVPNACSWKDQQHKVPNL